MNINSMELNMDEMELVNGSGPVIGEVNTSDICYHPNAVKTSIGYEDEFFIFWTRYRRAYLCPDCKRIIWVDEDP